MNKKQKRSITILILISAILILAGIVGFYFWNRNKAVKPLSNNQNQINDQKQATNLNVELINAAKDGDLVKVQELIKAGADKYGIPLMQACSDGNLGIVEELIKAGADVNAKDEYGQTALMQASYRYNKYDVNVGVIKALIAAGADVNAKNSSGYTALIIVSGSGSIDGVRELIAAGADVNSKTNPEGETALMAASGAGVDGYPEIVKELIENGADINFKTSDGKTALIWASEGGYLDIVKILKDAGVWKTYKNDVFGFEFQYPSTNRDIPKMETYDCDGVSLMKDCSSIQKGQSKEIVNINNIPFCLVETFEAAAGTSYDTYKYITVKGNQCLSVSFTLLSSCGGVGGGTGPEYEQCLKYEPNMLNEITTSFKLLK